VRFPPVNRLVSLTECLLPTAVDAGGPMQLLDDPVIITITLGDAHGTGRHGTLSRDPVLFPDGTNSPRDGISGPQGWLAGKI
jgi:hypothetical protein